MKANHTMKANYTVLTTDFYDMMDDYKAEYEETYGDIPNDNELYDFIYRSLQCDVDDLKMSIESFEKDDARHYIVAADIQRWNGTFKAYKMVEGMWEAIRACVSGCEEYDIYVKNGLLRIDTSHHDGTNHFTIREVKPEGIDYWDRHSYDDGDFTILDKMYRSSRWTRRVTIFNELWGI